MAVDPGTRIRNTRTGQEETVVEGTVLRQGSVIWIAKADLADLKKCLEERTTVQYLPDKIKIVRRYRII